MTGLDAAATFYEHQTLNGPFEQMKNEELHVVVFEDSTGGIRATQHAVKLLQDAGFNIQMQGVGVAPEESKRQALARLTDILVEDVNKGLRWILNN
jgi:flavorubredoxin